MIYTLTLNPALDHIVRVDNLQLSETNRMAQEDVVAGGKGINVSKILRNLGQDSTALGFLAGFSGKELERQIRQEGIGTDFIDVGRGFTRINVKIKAQTETEINGPGLDIREEDKKALLEKLDQLKDGDILFLSGSVPASLGDGFYREIMENLKDRDVTIAVDTIGKALLNTLDLKPFLIKPNHRELEEIFSVDLNSMEDIEKYARKLQERTKRHVIISLGGDGALYISESKEAHYLEAPQGKLIDTVGSGDSMVASFVYAKNEGFEDLEAFKFSVAAGSATAFSLGLASREDVDKLYKKLRS